MTSKKTQWAYLVNLLMQVVKLEGKYFMSAAIEVVSIEWRGLKLIKFLLNTVKLKN